MESVYAAKPVPVRLDWLDGLRTYAVLGVLIVHSSQLLYHDNPRSTPQYQLALGVSALGQYGVQLFFIISALTVSYSLGRQPFSWNYFLGWMTKRFFRIAPLYYLAIPVYFVIDTMLNVARAHAHKPLSPVFSLPDAINNVLFIHSWTPGGNNNVVPGGWSIGVEMMFYLIAPLCFLVLQSIKFPVLPFALIASAGLLLTRALNHGPVLNNTLFYYWFPTEFPVFLCGLLLYWHCRSWLLTAAPAPRWATVAALTIGIPCFALSGLCGAVANWNNLLAPTLFGIAFCCLMILAREPWKLLFEHPAIVWIGRISFSMYIVHFAVLAGLHGVDVRFSLLNRMPPVLAVFLVVLVCFAITTAIAAITRRLIEEPSIQLGHRLAKRICSGNRNTQAVVSSEAVARDELWGENTSPGSR